MSLYRNILVNAFKFSWRYKYLWIFGVFASFLSTSGGYEMIISALRGGDGIYAPGLQGLIDSGLFTSEGTSNLKLVVSGADAGVLASMAFVVVMIVILFSFVVWISVVSQVAIVKESASLISKKEAKISGQDNIKRGLESGMRHFWQVFGVNVVSKVLLTVFFSLVSAPLLATVGQETGFAFELLFVVAFVLFLVLTLSISFIAKYAIVANVTRGLELVESIKFGARVFLNNWIISLELAFILFSLNFLVGIVLMLAVLILAMPLYFLSIVLLKLTGIAGFWLVAVPGAIAVFVLITMTGAMLTCFQIGSWTALFVDLTGKKIHKSKIVRVAEGLKK